jgi:hypothetical protein
MTMCTCGHSAAEHPDGDACIVEGDANWGMWADGCMAFTPAAPAEPPAADSPTPGTDDFRPVLGEPETPAYPYPAAPSPVDTTETPPSSHDGEVCITWHCARSGCDWNTWVLPEHEEGIAIAHAIAEHGENRPATPSEPPAEAQQDDELRGELARWLAWGYGGDEYADQAGSREHWLEMADLVLALPAMRRMRSAALAARLSADTETLRERIEVLADDLDETVLALGRLGDLHHVVERLRAALDAR